MAKTVTRAYFTDIVWPKGYEHLPTSIRYRVEMEPCDLADEEEETQSSARAELSGHYGVEPISFEVEIRDALS